MGLEKAISTCPTSSMSAIEALGGDSFSLLMSAVDYYDCSGDSSPPFSGSAKVVLSLGSGSTSTLGSSFASDSASFSGI